MTDSRTTKHDTLLSGVHVKSGVNNQLVGEGTLTGLAYGKDGKRVLVACRHTLTEHQRLRNLREHLH